MKMAREKFDFGIDLGTTNSAIAVMDNGQLKIIKSDKYQKDTTPSKVAFTRKVIRTGDDAVGKKFVSEFKRTMGTDKKYSCEYMDHPYSSEELSAEVLKQLKNYVSDENIQAAIITVPNQFHQNQIDATQRAAELAGFQACELLQEPIAASMAFGLEAEFMDGFWIVFDFGGGTFDSALMRVDEGIMKVVDTDGDNHLGGKDIDTAIIDNILIPLVRADYSVDKLLTDDDEGGVALRYELKLAAEALKISLSSKTEEVHCSDEPVCEDDDGEEIDLDFSVSLKEYEKVVTPIFQKAIDITKQLLKRNNISSDLLGSILLVGGPTFSQTLRRMLKEQFDTKIDTSIDPMTSVARGAALFASTKSIPNNLKQRDSEKIQLKLKYPETTVEIEENLGVLIDRDSSEGTIPETLFLEVSRGDGGWSSGKIKIDDAEIVEVHLDTGKPNIFNILITDNKGNKLSSEPSTITMIQGFKAAKATLPHSICIDSVLADSGKQRLVALDGLEKNNTLPAKGKGTFKTQKAIRPGNINDLLIIPIIEGEPGEQSKFNTTAAVINCSGDDLAALLPKGSDVELTVLIDESRRIKLSAYFPYIDESYDVEVAKSLDTQQGEVDSSLVFEEIRKAQHAVAFIDGGEVNAISNELTELDKRLNDAQNDYAEKSKALSDLNVILKKIDKLEGEAEWPKLELRLKEALDDLHVANEQYGNSESTIIVRQMEASSFEIIKQKDKKLALDLIDKIGSLSFSLIRQETGLWISYIKGFDDDFNTQQWSDEGQARELINQAKHIISTQPSRDKLERIVITLFGLLPTKDQPVTHQVNSDLLVK